MWKSGRAATMTSRRLLPTVSQPFVWQALITRFEWLSIAPFEVPVVPPVYCRQATSDGAKPCGFGFLEARRTVCHSWKTGLLPAAGAIDSCAVGDFRKAANFFKLRG